MTTEAGYFWFRLFSTRGVGPKRLASVARALKKAQLAPEDLPDDRTELLARLPELARIMSDNIPLEDKVRVFEEYRHLERERIDIIYPGLSGYPLGLLEHAENFGISPVLLSKGRKSLLRADGVAIVGSRSASPVGLEIARAIAADLARHDANVISGYAKGVDSEAHLSALEVEGTTTIVLSYGIRKLRKKRAFRFYDWHRDVLAVSQFRPDAKWSAWNAMARNKLVCALSRAVVVVESGPERDSKGRMSGTFDAGRTALRMGVPLFVVTPTFFDQHPKGNRDLIKLGGIEFDPASGTQRIIGHIRELRERATTRRTMTARSATGVANLDIR